IGVEYIYIYIYLAPTSVKTADDIRQLVTRWGTTNETYISPFSDNVILYCFVNLYTRTPII
ncbi:MAG: hypothetical protein ACJBCI_06225, partial [Candidatus Tisiphia sp.]